MNCELTKSNLKIAWRNLMKYRLQTLISILSLAVGMVCFSLSALWLRWELSYDNFWPDADKMYMVQHLSINYEADSTLYKEPVTPFPLALHLLDKFPEVVEACNCECNNQKVLVDSVPYPVTVLHTDSSFVQFFGIKVLEGNPHFRLHNDETAITRSMAQRMFPDGGALGSVVNFEGTDGARRIVAVVEDPQQPNSIPFDLLLCHNEETAEAYNILVAYTFVKADPAGEEQLLEKLKNDTIVEMHAKAMLPDGTIIRATMITPYPMDLVPITKIRTETPLQSMNVSIDYLYFFMALGVLVIVCGLFNYFAMLLTRIRMRQRELVLRYVHGATRGRLLWLLATELLLIMAFAALLALLLTMWFLPEFRELCCIEQENDFFLLWFGVYAMAVMAVSLVLTMVIIHFSCRKQLQHALGRQQLRPQSAWNHRANLFVQMMVCLCTVFCSTVMLMQIHYLFTSPDMGFSKHNIGVMIFYEDKPELAEDLRALPEIEQVMYGYGYPIPSSFFRIESLWVTNEHTKDGGGVYLASPYVSQEYCDMIGMQLLEGAMVQQGETDKILVNETAARLLGLEHPVGERVEDGRTDTYYTIKGMVKDLYNEAPTKHPTGYFFRAEPFGSMEYSGNYLLTFRYKEGTQWAALEEKIYDLQEKHFGHRNDGTIKNAEKEYHQMVSSEEALAKMLGLTTIVSILISVFGIFSTLSLALQRRRKEIALRKIHGAKVRDIFRLFLSEYVWLLLGAAVVAFPIGFYLMHQWLSQYTRQVPFAWWLCPAILLAMAALILLTVFWQIWRAAKANAAEVVKE